MRARIEALGTIEAAADALGVTPAKIQRFLTPGARHSEERIVSFETRLQAHAGGGDFAVRQTLAGLVCGLLPLVSGIRARDGRTLVNEGDAWRVVQHG